MEIKYIDKKKVVVVGKVNSTDTIVQEIYIVNGAEVPQGENFVVKTEKLKDSPSETWEEMQIRIAKEKYKKEVEKYERLTRQKNAEMRRIVNVTDRKITELKMIDKNLNSEQFETFYNFISGRYKYIVKECYSDCEIIGFNTAIYNSGETHYDYQLKLITFFGRENGFISVKLNQYSDGSGVNYTIHPFKKYDDAVSFVKKKICDKKEVYDGDIKTAEKYGFEIPKEKIEAYKQRKIKEAEKIVENSRLELEKAEKKLKDILENEVTK
jgi:hypothetical protein